MKIEVVDYNYKHDETKTRTAGYIAQDLYKVFPDAVTVGGEDVKVKPWAVDYGKLTPLLVKAIQDQQDEISALKAQLAEVNDLKAQLTEVNNLKAEVASIRQLLGKSGSSQASPAK